jgi:hypothetical protein
MKKWLKFIIIPILVFFLLSPLLSAISVFFFPPDMMKFHQNPQNYTRFIEYIIEFFSSSFLVVVIFINKPYKNNIAPTIYSLFFLVFSLYLAISTHGNKIEIIGQIVTQKFSKLDIVYTVGLIVALFGSLLPNKSIGVQKTNEDHSIEPK